jgi:hypothetical protein
MLAMKYIFSVASILFFLSAKNSIAQKEQNNWFFSSTLGLNFGSTPPSTLNMGQTFTQNGTASISDGNGNLLFYTNGTTVFNQNHLTMANGSGLFGSLGSQQTALIIKQPSSNDLYYIFTVGSATNQIYNYSIVDISLAAGIGSVTIKNAPLWNPTTNSSRILSGTQHCNGIDYWIVCHELGTAVFHSYLLTASGVNTVAVVSIAGNSLCCSNGAMKLSPNGKKIAVITRPQTTNGEITINDFDNSTGAVLSNSLVLNGIAKLPIGIEFSPSGNLFYGAGGMGGTATSTISNTIMQWNLCAGDNQAVNASMQVLSSPVTTINSANTAYGLMQTGPNGKIYVSRTSQFWIAVVDYPDSIGASSSFVNQGIYTHPIVSALGLPNFITSNLRTSPIKLPGYTVTCQDVSFNALTSTQQLCAASGYTLLSSFWDFGDPLSGNSNTTTALNATHHYSSLGTYTASFIAHYQCTSDTIKQIISIVNASPSFSVTGKTTICKGESATLTANGAYSYSWSTNSTSNSVVVSPTLNTQYTVVATNTTNACKTIKTHSITVAKCTGLINFKEEESDFLVYPNPTDGNFIIVTNVLVNLFIYNKLGQLVYKSLNEIGKQTINLSELERGIYFIELSNQSMTKKLKLIKVE